MSNEKSIVLTLSRREAETVLNALGQRPFLEVATLFAKVSAAVEESLRPDTDLHA